MEKAICGACFSSVGSEVYVNHDCPLILVTGGLHNLTVIFTELFILCAGSPLIFPSSKIILTFLDLHLDQDVKTSSLTVLMLCG